MSSSAILRPRRFAIGAIAPSSSRGAPLAGGVGTALDAAGLGFFAVAGAQKTAAAGLHPLIAIAMGGVTGAGGGALRDVLLARIPVVLHADVYATAAIAGAAVMLASRR